MSKYLLIDVATQKKFVESFGEEAVPFAPAVRENFMHITSMARKLGFDVLSLVVGDISDEKNDKVMDTLMEGGNQRIMELQKLDDLQDEFGQYDAIFVFGIGEKFLKEVFEKISKCEAKLWIVEDAIKDWEEEAEAELIEFVKDEFEARKITTRNLDKYLRM